MGHSFRTFLSLLLHRAIKYIKKTKAMKVPLISCLIPYNLFLHGFQMFASTGRRPEKEVFDTLKAKPKVLESETYMIMKPAIQHNRKFSKDNNSSQEYLKMSMTYISDAT